METLLITELTIKSYLQFTSLKKKLLIQNTIYNSSRLKKKDLVSIEKNSFH